MVWKISLLVICEILALFLITLTADGKYSLCNRQNLRQAVQMQLSQKIFFSDFVASFLDSTSNFEHFEEKDDLQSLWTFQNREWERRG